MEKGEARKEGGWGGDGKAELLRVVCLSKIQLQ